MTSAWQRPWCAEINAERLDDTVEVVKPYLDRVRYIGDGVAAVAAIDEDTALRALALIDVRVLDHFIVTAEDSLSFAEKGLL